jgi:hypothetical protein
LLTIRATQAQPLLPISGSAPDPRYSSLEDQQVSLPSAQLPNGLSPAAAVNSASQSAVLRFNPGSTYAYACTDVFTAALEVQDVADLGGYGIIFAFDPNVVHVQDIVLGSLITSSGRPFTLEQQIDSNLGQASLDALSSGSLPGPSGSGSLAVVTFSPVQAGTTTLALQRKQLTDTFGALIPVESTDGSATVVPAPYGDVDGDCDVDVVDIMLVATRWNATLGEPRYDPRYDLDGDGDIDVVDVMLVASHWGETGTVPPTPIATSTVTRTATPTGVPPTGTATPTATRTATPTTVPPTPTATRTATPTAVLPTPTATLAVTPTIAVNDFANYRVFQRDIGGTSKSVGITGTYSNMNWSRVEARLLQHGTDMAVLDWATIDSTPGGGTFSGNLTVPQGGWYNIEVRAVDGSGSVIGSSRGTNKWGVGMVILAIGQSNMVGMGHPPFTVADSDLAVNYSNAGRWEHLADPYDDESPPGAVDNDNYDIAANNGGGSMIPALANSLLQTFDFPIAFVPSAKSGSNLYSQWAYRNPSNHYDTSTLYGQSITKAQKVGGVELIIMHQGEADTNAHRTEAQYESDFATMIGHYRQDLYATIPIFICQLGTISIEGGDPRTDADVVAVRNAQHDLDNGVDIFMAATAMDQPRIDDVHYTAAGLNAIGGRMAQAIKYHFGATSYYRGPAIISAFFANGDRNTVDVEINHRGGDDITPVSGITGFSLFSNGSPVSITSAARMSADSIRLTLASAIPQGTTTTLRYLWGSNPSTNGLVKDNSSLALPLENTTADVAVSGLQPTPTATPTAAPPTPTATPPPARLTCPTATTLEQLIACIINQGPYSDGAGYVEPSSTVKADWQTVVRSMMNGSCDFALPASLAPVMTIMTFADSGNTRSYCVLYETADANLNGKVDKGWGTFIAYNASTKALVIQSPHPVFDSTTESEAITVFKETSAHAFLLMGAHRNASSVSACQSGYYISDPAHDVRDVFNPTVVELKSYFGSNPYWVLQFHGMAVDSCSDNVYMSNGFTVLPPTGTRIWQLYDALHTDHPTWSIDLTGQGSCSLSGATSTTGRIINGIAITSACSTDATTNTGYFIHIEQDPNNRTASDWSPAINTVWP